MSGNISVVDGRRRAPRRRSAGLLLYRVDDDGGIAVLLVHPGGPFWASKDDGAWSIPKGEYVEPESAAEAATREFEEELGLPPPVGARIDLGEVQQSGGKLVHAWAVQAQLDVSAVAGNTFEMPWPPKSGQLRSFPEIDRAAWFSLPEAASKVVAGQRPLLDRLVGAVRPVASPDDAPPNVASPDDAPDGG